MPGTITVRDDRGNALDVDEALLPQYEARGYKAEGINEQAGRLAAEHRTETYGTPVGAFAAAGTGALSTITGGASDLALRGIGGGDVLRAVSEESPYARLGGTIAGALLPVGAVAGAARVGKGVAGALGEGVIARGLGGVAEGGVYGLGSGASEVALSRDPLTWEQAASTIGSHVLFGGALGGAGALAGSAVERGLAEAKGLIDKKIAQSAADRGITDVAPDILALDARGLKAAREAEVVALEETRVPLRRNAVDELDAYRNTNRDASWVRDTVERNVGATRDTMEASASFTNADFKLRKLLDNRAALTENPKSALYHLQSQRQALEEIIPWAERTAQRYEADVAAAPEYWRRKILNGDMKGSGYVIGKGGMSPNGPGGVAGFNAAIDAAVEREVAFARTLNWNPESGSNGLKPPRVLEHLDDFKMLAARNRQLQEQFTALSTPVTSPRLSAIDSAREALSIPHQPSLGERVLNAVPGGRLVGELAGVGSKPIGAIKAAIGKGAARTGEAVSSFLGAASKGVSAATPYAPVLATKVLQAVRYAPESPGRKQAEPEPTSGPAATALAKAWKARTDEVKSQTEYGPDGVPRLRVEARKAMAARFDGIRPQDPILADRLEMLAARRIEYLSSLIPRRPDFGGVRNGPDYWQPSDMEMRSWARSAAALEDPHAVLERAVHGAVTPEDADALRAVYPGLLADFSNKVAGELPTLRHKLPIARQTALSILTGVAVDPAMHPDVLRVLQSQYTYEPEAPRAEPQFGSVRGDKLEPGTPAQQREQGAV